MGWGSLKVAHLSRHFMSNLMELIGLHFSFLFYCSRGVLVFDVEVGLDNKSSNLNEAVFISHSANTPVENRNRTIFPQKCNTVLFNLGWPLVLEKEYPEFKPDLVKNGLRLANTQLWTRNMSRTPTPKPESGRKLSLWYHHHHHHHHHHVGFLTLIHLLSLSSIDSTGRLHYILCP